MAVSYRSRVVTWNQTYCIIYHLLIWRKSYCLLAFVCVCVCVSVCTRLFLSCNLDSNVCPIPFQTRPGVVTLSSELTSITSLPRPVMEHLSLALSIRGYSGGIMEEWPIRHVVLYLSLRELQKRGGAFLFHTLIHFIYVYIQGIRPCTQVITSVCT